MFVCSALCVMFTFISSVSSFNVFDFFTYLNTVKAAASKYNYSLSTLSANQPLSDRNLIVLLLVFGVGYYFNFPLLCFAVTIIMYCVNALASYDMMFKDGGSFTKQFFCGVEKKDKESLSEVNPKRGRDRLPFTPILSTITSIFSTKYARPCRTLRK